MPSALLSIFRLARRGNPAPPVAALLAAFCLVFALPASAQDAASDDEEEQEETVEEAEADYGDIEEVVVTGSRLKRDTYTSITPLQIITAEVKREAGLIDAGEIIQEATTASGLQVDLTFTGLVLDDGPGTVTANLRGLGASRTLVLLNGRRIAPAAVEGAPSNPNLNVVPGILVQQYDQLLDGASSVYGSDAVAGVINAILRKDFNGFQIEASPSIPTRRGGDQRTVGLSWGKNMDRGFIGVGVQYYESQPVTLEDRPWTAGCERHVEQDQTGRIRHEGLFYSVNYGMKWDDCTIGSLAGAVVTPTGWTFYTPGYSNGGWPDFSAWGAAWLRGRFGIDGDGDGESDVSFRDYSLNGRTQFRHLSTDFKTSSAMAYGEYTLEGEMNLTPYFEVLRSETDNFIDAGAYQLFPDVPPLNPYNICNPQGQGVDCGLARDALYSSPGYIAQFGALYGDLCAAFGVPLSACSPLIFRGQRLGPIGPQETTPIASVRGDRTLATVEVVWLRGVAGISGDLPFMNVGSLSDWSFDGSITVQESTGTSQRPGVREDRLNLALGVYSTTNRPCENNTGAQLEDDVAPGCVPVNMFAPSLYADVIGDFATQAERNYLFDNRDYDTTYRMTLFSLYATGDLFNMPAGAAAGVIGVEQRVDEIASLPDVVARDGLMFGYSKDGGAEGERTTREAFGEIELPLLGGKVAAEELTVNLSARWTDDEFYGGAWTGAAKVGWRPVDSLLIRGTYGTSYRAPNMRELFLRDQTGFGNVFDPCLIPLSAFRSDLATGQRVYDPELDDRDPHVLERCRAHGVDPTLAWRNGNNTYNIEIASAGALSLGAELDEETSQSLSFGFSWQQPFTEAFEMTLGMTYYDIEIEDTIIEPSAGYIVFDCYSSRTSSGTFCDRITRDLSNPTLPLMTYIREGFINRDSQWVRGVDLNIAFNTTVDIFERPVRFGLDIVGHRLIENADQYVNDGGEVDYNTYHREWYYPEHKAEALLRVDYDRWRFSWTARYQGNQLGYPAPFADKWGDVYTPNDPPDTNRGNTCRGPRDGDLLCKDIEGAPDYWIHHASLTYSGDTWRVLGGLRNVFDVGPPQVDGTELGTSDINNTPRGAGYDLDGRTYFLIASFNFGGE